MQSCIHTLHTVPYWTLSSSADNPDIVTHTTHCSYWTLSSSADNPDIVRQLVLVMLAVCVGAHYMERCP